MKTRLTHVRANVSDLHRAIAWYEDVVGFECLGADITEIGRASCRERVLSHV